jgi:hypothetical protein
VVLFLSARVYSGISTAYIVCWNNYRKKRSVPGKRREDRSNCAVPCLLPARGYQFSGCIEIEKWRRAFSGACDLLGKADEMDCNITKSLTLARAHRYSKTLTISPAVGTRTFFKVFIAFWDHEAIPYFFDGNCNMHEGTT